MKNRTPERPKEIKDSAFRYDAFASGKVMYDKRKHLPAMGWNSWNAFGSGNTESLTLAMADAMVELGLDQLGYEYLVLDDGCYQSKREGECLTNEPVKFPRDFRKLADDIHAKGLKFGMYNDIGTNLCAGAAVGTCGYEAIDAQSYMDWDIDFIKVDNCYYLWDNATFSDASNTKYVYAPNIAAIRIEGGNELISRSAVEDGILIGCGAEKRENYVTNIGTFDGTGPEHTPVGAQSGELVFNINVPEEKTYQLSVRYATGEEVGIGSWLQVAVGEGMESVIAYDDFLPQTETTESFADSMPIDIHLQAGENKLRLMNHRRQENTLDSYATLLKEFHRIDPHKDIVLSICEWGKTQPQNWGYKVGDSWRILNDITFQVGAENDPGHGTWTDDYTASVTSQYNKAVIMDEFAGLDRGWNDPDMLMVGMNGLTDTMCRTHFAMWCMMNAPLMLGLDLRRVRKHDEIWNIIAKADLIALNQDALGIQAKRIYCSLEREHPDQCYITDNDRVDILAKPLADHSIALSFINLSEHEMGGYAVSVQEILDKIGHKMVDAKEFGHAAFYEVKDLWTGEKTSVTGGKFEVEKLDAYGNVTIRVTPR